MQICNLNEKTHLHHFHAADDLKDGQVPKRPRSVSKESSTVSVAAEPTPLQEPTSCRDMGTQMTPVESLKNSTCTTPGLAGSPTRHCNTPAGRWASSLGAVPAAVDLLELQGCHLAKLELRQLAGGDQPSIDRKAIWATREEEEMESSASLREDPEDLDRCQLSTKATAWEEAEQTKVLVRLLFLLPFDLKFEKAVHLFTKLKSAIGLA